MIVPIIIAIWFSIKAKSVGKNRIKWALIGAVLTWGVATFFVNLGVLITTGSFKGPMEVGPYITNLVIMSLVAIGVVVWMGNSLFFNPELDDTPPEFYDCPDCGAELELDEEELLADSFICPVCGNTIERSLQGN